MMGLDGSPSKQGENYDFRLPCLPNAEERNNLKLTWLFQIFGNGLVITYKPRFYKFQNSLSTDFPDLGNKTAWLMSDTL